MASPASLLRGARAFARDFPRDQMPQQYMWDIVDYVPIIVDAGLTGRGGWQWGSGVMGGDPAAGILASFPTGEKLLWIGTDNQWYEVDQNSPYAATARGAAPAAKQNPVQAGTAVLAFDANRTRVPQVVTAPSGTLAFANMDASAKFFPVGGFYKEMAVAAGAPGEENYVRFGHPGNLTGAWDLNSNLVSSKPVTAIGALRAVIIVFHAGSTERIRGATPPHTGDNNFDMSLEPLFDRVGCTDPRSIAYWQDNCIFADEHGVHMTDGAVVRNLASQGGILYYWRLAYANQISVAGCAFLDYYQVTIRRSDGSSDTLICDLNKRQWFRFSNFYALSYVASSGSTGMERAWAGMAGTKRLARVGPMYFPLTSSSPLTLAADGDGKAVLPSFQTAWYRMGREGRKRTRFAYLSYDARTSLPTVLEKGQYVQDGVPFELQPQATTPILDVGFTTSPMDPNYIDAGGLPATSLYSRYKLPISRAPYGIAFRVNQLQPTYITRIYDLAVEAGAMEASRQ